MMVLVFFCCIFFFFLAWHSRYDTPYILLIVIVSCSFVLFWLSGVCGRLMNHNSSHSLTLLTLIFEREP
jgi:hypothetical protein